MYVDNQPFAFTTLDAAIAALEALPTAFSARTKVSTVFFYANAEASALHNAGIEAARQGAATDDKEKLKTAGEAFNQAARKSAQSKDYVAQAYDLMNYGRTALLTGDYATAAASLEKAARLDLRAGSLDHFYADIGCLYEALHNLSQQPHGNTEELGRKMAAVRKKALWAVENENHEPVNPDAYRVEQNEIGFSDKAPIGTDKIFQCVCVIVRDPLTHKTAIAHIDYHTDINSLQKLFDRMPADRRLEVKIVGAWQLAHGNKEFSQRAVENMKKVTDFLATKEYVDIRSTDIYNSGQPHALVIDPETGAVTEERPGRNNPDHHLANGLPPVGYMGKPLHIAFDLTQSPRRVPHLLTMKEIISIQNYSRNTPQQIYAYFKKNGAAYTEAASATELISACTKAYQAATQYLIKIMDRQIAEKEKTGIKIPPEKREEIINTLQNVQLHVGAGANEFNRPLEDFIRNNLFTVPQGGDACVINIGGLHKVQLGAIPYEKIEAEKRQRARPSPQNKTEALRP